MAHIDTAPSWSVVVPVKRLPEAKSRLAEWAGARRAELALAVCLDTVRGALASVAVGRVVVVTDDTTAASALRHLPNAERALVLTEDVPDAGLNPALRHGAAVAAAHDPHGGCAALSADLPALRPRELTRVLDAAAGQEQCFLADAAGVGTTLYAVRAGAAHPFEPNFGGPSRLRHLDAGAAELRLRGVTTVRRDVDTPADLRAATELGVGPATARFLGGTRPAPTSGRNDATRAR